MIIKKKLTKRLQAKAAGSRYYYTGITCKNGHDSKRFTHNGACYTCVQLASKKRYTYARHNDLIYRKKRIINQKRNWCLRNKTDFDLTVENLNWPINCPVLGIPLNYLDESTKDLKNAPSLDRIDPTKGYTADNVRVISNRANRLKLDASVQEIELLLSYMKSL